MQRWSARPTVTEAAVDASAGTDPIYVAMQACLKAEGFVQWDCEKGNRLEQDPDDHTDSVVTMLQDAYKNFSETIPTSRAGIDAKIAFAADEARERHLDTFDEAEILSSLATALKRLGGASSAS
jgi:hypothetical protein